ncbi:hypothetical protein BN946_scf185043.g219 [Trametes cinnabarina]|uniref:Uncharacterized protein n=1 Tax=Pycnoporus cinnabarinus TaxID=5643 RepID=A0A060SNZ1_PYCCI|nr:hypothetical protein BN946_scf185043.g219 [Trametes cinnabarina]
MAPDLPSWTTLSSEDTSDEEVLLSDSRGTTPDPAEKDELTSNQPPSLSQVLPRHAPQSIRGKSRALKRRATDPARPQFKKSKLSGYTAPRPTGTDSPLLTFLRANKPVCAASPLPLSAHSDVLLTARNSHQTTHSRLQGVPLSEESKAPTAAFDGARSAPAGAPTRSLRKARLRAPITEDSDMAEWERVDHLLETHVAPAMVLPKYTQSSSLRGRGGLWHIRLQLDDFRQRSKGKGRAEPTWTETCWSNVGEFKERLDRMFGPGDIARGQGKAPEIVSHAKKASSVEQEDLQNG